MQMLIIVCFALYTADIIAICNVKYFFTTSPKRTRWDLPRRYRSLLLSVTTDRSCPDESGTSRKPRFLVPWSQTNCSVMEQ